MNTSTQFTVSLGGESVVCSADEALKVADELHKRHGGVPSVVPVSIASVSVDTVTVVSAPTVEPVSTLPAPVYSDFGVGNQVTDESAKVRIEALHAKLADAGIAVDTKSQLFATGTRLARIGYETQKERKSAHDAMMPLLDAAHALASAVRAEKREDKVVSAGDMAKAFHVNGKVTAFGLSLSEQAIRGLLTRLESPALSYILGLRNRIAAEVAKGADGDVNVARGDRAKIAEVLSHECSRRADVALKMRTRQASQDVFAIVSPSYVPADAPEVVDAIMHTLPRDAKGSFSYDGVSTAWELRAAIWTPTPTDEQAVGEPFQAYASYQARDNGTRRFSGGGGIELIRCLNASVYTAEGKSFDRVHRGGVMGDIAAMTEGALSAIHTLAQAWGRNREAGVEIERGVPIEVAMPGFWRHLLADRRSELQGVLPGRTETHVKGLTEAYFGERRNPTALVRADLAQGFTRYIQDQEPAVRKNAEAAIGDWLVNNRSKIQCDLKGAEVI